MDSLLTDEPMEPACRHCFDEAFTDNLQLVLDVIDSMRAESACIGEDNTASFLAGIGEAIAAYTRNNRPTAQVIPLRPANPS
jgi:hypothetical protein